MKECAMDADVVVGGFPDAGYKQSARFDTLFAENVLDVLLDVKNPTFWDGAIKITAFSK